RRSCSCRRLHVLLCCDCVVTSLCVSLSLHDALPILQEALRTDNILGCPWTRSVQRPHGHLVNTQGVRAELLAEIIRANRVHPVRSEEHTSELQSRFDLVCRLLLEKKKYAVLLQCVQH